MKTTEQTDVQDAQSLNSNTERTKRSSGTSSGSGGSSSPAGAGIDAPQKQTSSEETSPSTVQQQQGWVDPRVQQFQANMQSSPKMQHLAQLQAQADAYAQAQKPIYLNSQPAQLQDGATGAKPLENIIAKHAFTLTIAGGKTLQVEAGIMVTVYTYNDEGNPLEISVEIDGKTHRGTIDAATARTCFPAADTVTTIGYTDKKLQQVRDMVAQDSWYTNFGEEQAVSLVRGLNGGEIKELLGDSKLLADLRHYFSRKNWALSVEPWQMDLGEKFDLIEADDSGGLLDYNNDLRTMIFNSPRSKPLKEYEARIKTLTGVAVTFKDKLSPEEQAAYDKEHLYDDQKNKGNHKIRIESEDTDAMIRINEGNAKDEDKDAIIRFFQKNALAEAFAMLELSEKELQKTLEGYTDEQLNDIGKQFIAFMEAPSTAVKGKTNYEAYWQMPSQDRSLMEQMLLSQGDGMQQLGQTLADQQSRERARDKVHAALAQQLGRDFPMLCDRKVNLEQLYNQFKSKKYKTLRTQLETRTTTYLGNIRETRENLRGTPEMIFALDPVVANTFKNLGLSKESESGKVVSAHIQSIKNKELAISIALAALTIGLGVLSFFTGGTTALIAGATGAGVGAYDTYREYNQYSTKHAAANTSMRPAQVLTKDDPSFLWVAVSAFGVLGDIASTAKVLKALKASKILEKPLTDAADLGRYVDEATKVIAKEKGIKTGTKEYDAIRKTVEDEAKTQLFRHEAKTKAPAMKERVSKRIDHENTIEGVEQSKRLFEMRYTDAEIEDMYVTGRKLGLDDETTEAFIFTGSRNDKPIPANTKKDPKIFKKRRTAEEVLQEMHNYAEVVLKRGYPYLFKDKAQLTLFSEKLKGLLTKYNIPVEDIRIQGSALRTPNANDVDIVVFVKKEKFDALLEDMVAGMSSRIKRENSRKKMIGDLKAQAAKGKINSFNFDRLPDHEFSFNQDLYRMMEEIGMKTEGRVIDVDLSLLLKGENFDVKPYMGL